jgi:hemerythrin superfamily protein
MKKTTHYLVQTSKTDDIKWLKPLTLSKARKLYNKLREHNSSEVGGKFPRIIKVTTEYKTITK